MNFEELRSHWDTYARTDPLRAAADDGGAFELHRNAESAAADHLIAFAVDNGIDLKRARALDLGCRDGSLAQGLSRHFDHVVGVDLAPAHVELANRFNRHPDRCEYRVEGGSPLSAVHGERFDLICSSGLFLHLPTELVRDYLAAALRALAPGGAMVWNMPSERRIGGPVLDRVTVAIAPLPPEARRVEITVADHLEMPAAAYVSVPVTLKNTSPVRWPARGLEGRFQISLGNHWAAADGSMLVWDGSRAHLPVDLPPGESCAVEIAVVAPAQPGSYELQFDVVEEAVAWFSDRACPPARVAVRVHPAGESVSPSTSAPERLPRPSLPIHGVPRADVEALLVENGVHLAAAFEDHGAGEEWNGWLYLAGREQVGASGVTRQVDAAFKTQKLALDVLAPLGKGLEIGASSHNPFPGVRAWNVDLFSEGVFRDAQEALEGDATTIDVVGTADALPFRDGALGFVLASHVLEHMPDVLRALREWDRVVRSGGVVFMIVPHRERTFDRSRPRTPLAHLLADYATAMNIEDNALVPTCHYHVWTTEDLIEVLELLNETGFLDWAIEAVEDRDSKSGNGFTIVARKRSRTELRATPTVERARRIAFHQLTLKLPFRPSPIMIAQRPRHQTFGLSLEHTVAGETLSLPSSVPRGAYMCVPVFEGFPPVAGEPFSIEIGDSVPPPVIETVTRSGDLLVFEGRHLTPTTWIECDLETSRSSLLPVFQEGRLVVSIRGMTLPPTVSITPVTSPPGGGPGPVYRLNLESADA